MLRCSLCVYLHRQQLFWLKTPGSFCRPVSSLTSLAMPPGNAVGKKLKDRIWSVLKAKYLGSADPEVRGAEQRHLPHISWPFMDVLGYKRVHASMSEYIGVYRALLYECTGGGICGVGVKLLSPRSQIAYTVSITSLRSILTRMAFLPCLLDWRPV